MHNVRALVRERERERERESERGKSKKNKEEENAVTGRDFYFSFHENLVVVIESSFLYKDTPPREREREWEREK